jgi:hypothetical protein
MNSGKTRWLIERYHSEPVQHWLETLRRLLRPIARVVKTWPVIALLLAIALLLSFYAVVSAGAKRAEQQRLQDSQRAQAFSHCNALPITERRECQANVIATPTQTAQRQQRARPVRVADVRP